jgi:hypothetical protein
MKKAIKKIWAVERERERERERRGKRLDGHTSVQGLLLPVGMAPGRRWWRSSSSSSRAPSESAPPQNAVVAARVFRREREWDWVRGKGEAATGGNPFFSLSLHGWGEGPPWPARLGGGVALCTASPRRSPRAYGTGEEGQAMI